MYPLTQGHRSQPGDTKNRKTHISKPFFLIQKILRLVQHDTHHSEDI